MTLRKRQFLSASSNISKQDFLSKQQIFSLKKDKLEWNVLGHFGYFWPNYQHQFIWDWDLIGLQRIRNLAMVSVFRSLLNQLLILMHLFSISYFKSNYYRRSYIFLAVSKMVPFFTAEKKTPFLVLLEFILALLILWRLKAQLPLPSWDGEAYM
mgnify:CR=1 FL=1